MGSDYLEHCMEAIREPEPTYHHHNSVFSKCRNGHNTTSTNGRVPRALVKKR